METCPRLASIFLSACLLAPIATAQDATAPTVTNVYKNDFNDKVNKKIWPMVERRNAGDGKGYILFGTWMPTFEMRDLPAHQFARARMRILIHGSVSGTPVDGLVDYWTASVRKGPVLFRPSFQSPNDRRAVHKGFGQSFPDEFPAGLHPPQTGAAAVNQHGLLNGGNNVVYEFELVFPHQGKDLVIEFQEVFRDRGTGGWYFLGFELDVVSGPVPRGQPELDALWKKLAGDDPMGAFKAVNELIASGKQGTEFVAKKWKELISEPVPDLEQEKRLAKAVAKHAEQLGAKNFVDRVAAQSELKKLGVRAIPYLEDKLREKPVPGVRAALKNLITSLTKLEKGKPDNAYKVRLIGNRVARVLRISGETTRGLTITGSSNGYLGALVDGYAGDEGENFYQSPAHMMWDAKEGGEGWVQYSYDEGRTFDSAEVYWLGSADDDAKGPKMPESWSLSYLDGEKWKPIKPKDKYLATKGKLNRVEFAPITTKAIKLTAKSKADSTRTGLQEFQLGEVKRKRSKPKAVEQETTPGS